MRKKGLEAQSIMPDSFVTINRNNIRDLPRPNFIEWLISEEKELPGVPTKCYELRWVTDEAALESWALHVRRHYIRDDELYEDCKAYGEPIEKYLQASCIPTRADVDKLGPLTRSGDFAEIIISDMLQFIEGLTVPRYKQIDRINPNSSDQGSDVIGYKVTNPNLPRSDDALLAVEVKAKLTDPIDLAETIAKAAKDSKKDDPKGRFRTSLSLRMLEKRSRAARDQVTANECRRFMRLTEQPFVFKRGSAVVVSLDEVGDLTHLSFDELGLSEDDRLIIVHGQKLMDLVHCIYDRCVK